MSKISAGRVRDRSQLFELVNSDALTIREIIRGAQTMLDRLLQ